MNINKALTIAAGLSLVMTAGAANAQTFTFDSSGFWTESELSNNNSASGDGTDTISWGVPATNDGQSSYNFTGLSNGSLTVGQAFDFGTFTHNNFPIFAPSLESAKLNVNLDILGATSQTFSFLFDHFETPNNANPCAAGGVSPCPDLVSFPNNTSEQTIEIGGEEYNLTLLGFNGVDEFLTLENQANEAILSGKLTKVVPPETVPEPMALLGLVSVGGVATLLKRKQQAA
jgi:hypothetical protein